MAAGFDFAGGFYRNLTGASRDEQRQLVATRPADPDPLRQLGAGQHLHSAVLRPIARASMDFAGRAQSPRCQEPHGSPNSAGIARWAFEPDSQSRLRALIFE